MAMARRGNWVWYFVKDPIVMPKHSNIIIKYFPDNWFYPKAIFSVLKKKKKFDEILVCDEKLGRVLAALSFIHKAKIKYY